MGARPADRGRDLSPSHQPGAGSEPSEPAAPRLIIGLGNPGPKYVGTRHNVGFLVVEKLAADHHEPFEHSKRWVADVARFGHGCYLAKPLTYMNLSGEAVAKIAQFYRIEPAQILVVYDDIALPLGRLRIRPSGSAGGHNGMRSIIQHLGTERFPRLRVGIGNTETQGDTVGHVLGKFSKSERSELEKAVERAVLAVCHIRDHGLQDAMTLFNAAENQMPAKPVEEPAPKPAKDQSDPSANHLS
jgi:PTH1 family peptidyl-tRNA hydrolase